MFWKNWPYWLKGGIYGGIFLFIFGFVNKFRTIPYTWGLLTGIELSFLYGLLFGLGGFFLGLIGSLLSVYFHKKNFASWIVGGVLAVLFTILYFGFFLFFGRQVGGLWIGPFILIYLIPVFLIGALIGWIYGKIKNIIKK